MREYMAVLTRSGQVIIDVTAAEKEGFIQERDESRVDTMSRIERILRSGEVLPVRGGGLGRVFGQWDAVVFFTEDTLCNRCGSPLDGNGRCTDETCPFSDYGQDDPRGWANHPDRKG